MKKKAVIFGVGTFGEFVSYYLENDSCYEVAAFCSTDEQKNSTFCEKPLVDFYNVEKYYPPHEFEMFIAIGCRKMNELRKEFCMEARSKGYKLLSYISSKATYWDKGNKIGDNVFVFENNNIQPFVEIEDGVILWSGNHVGHHSKIGAYSFLSSHVVISGFCKVGAQSFFGVNSTMVDNISVGSKVLVGAGALITKSLSDNQVILGEKGKILDKTSEYFFR